MENTYDRWGEDQQKPGNRLHLQTSKHFHLERSLKKKRLTRAYCLVCSRGGLVGAPTSSLATVVVPPAVGEGVGPGVIMSTGGHTESSMAHMPSMKSFESQQVLKSVAPLVLQPSRMSVHCPLTKVY